MPQPSSSTATVVRCGSLRRRLQPWTPIAASVTKTFTVMALLQLVDQGQVSLALEHRHFDRTVIGPEVRADRSCSRDRRSRPSRSALQEPYADINDE